MSVSRAKGYLEAGLTLGADGSNSCDPRSNVADGLLEAGTGNHDLLQDNTGLIVHADRCRTAASHQWESD